MTRVSIEHRDGELAVDQLDKVVGGGVPFTFRETAAANNHVNGKETISDWWYTFVSQY